MSKPTDPINLVWLYARDMNVYGDYGNLLTLKRRIEWHGYKVNVIEYNLGDKFPENADLIVGGGGQDSGQDKIQNDLIKIGPELTKLAESDVPMLMICGLYQLFGHSFETIDGRTIKGIGLFDAKTQSGRERLIGNIVVESDIFGEIIGYENHSGVTTLGRDVKPLGRVMKGAGNNGRDDTEGAIFKNVIGSYMHGSLLPKNPIVSDWLIEKAITRKFGDFIPSVIDDRFATLAREAALTRPR